MELAGPHATDVDLPRQTAGLAVLSTATGDAVADAVLFAGPDGRRYLWKRGDARVPMAAAVIVARLGLRTPQIIAVRHRGTPGYIQEWVPDTVTETALELDSPEEFRALMRSPRYRAFLADLRIVDRVLRHTDRQTSNWLIEHPGSDAEDYLLIDHKRTLEASIDLDMLPSLGPPSAALAQGLRDMAAGWPELRRELSRWLGAAQLDALHHRLTIVIRGDLPD